MAYQFYLHPARLPPDYIIHDFQVLDQGTKVALLLERENGYFSPALWFPQSDSLHIWKQIQGSNHWLIPADQSAVLISDHKSPSLFEINLDSGKAEIINPPFPSSTPLCIVGQLSDKSLLLRPQPNGPTIQYWRFKTGAWSLAFEFPKGWYRWLGQVGDDHYFFRIIKRDKRVFLPPGPRPVTFRPDK
jgi:hypothetical protein